MDRTHYCRSIVIAGHTGDTQLIESALVDDDAGVRVLAIGAAARLGLLDAGRLMAYFDDPATDVRYRALELLPGLPDRAEATDAVTGLLDDPELAEVAAYTLGEIEPQGAAKTRAVAALSRQATSHDDPLCRESAVAALGSLGDGLNAILAACGDVATVRRRAVLALAPFDGPDVDQALEAALSDRDWQVRQAAEDLTVTP